MQLDRQYLLWGLVYAAIGMALGIHMAATEMLVQKVTHAHVLLVGFLMSLTYGMVHKMWLSGRSRRLGLAQFILHQAGAVIMFIGLFVFYGQPLQRGAVEPLLKISSILVLAAVVLMFMLVLRDARD